VGEKATLLSESVANGVCLPPVPNKKSKVARVLLWSVPMLLLLFGIFWVHLLNVVGGDDWIERHFLRYASHSAVTRRDARVMIITIDPARTDGLGEFDDGTIANQKWRAAHAELLAKLVGAQARLVAFDLTFPAPAAQYTAENSKLADALRAANASPRSRALVGYERAMDANPAIDAVLTKEQMGLVSVRELTNDLESGQYLARVLLAESLVTPSALGAQEQLVRPVPLPLAMYLADQELERGKPSVSVDPSRGGLVLRWPNGESRFIQTEVSVCEIGSTGCDPQGNPGNATELRRAVMPLWMGTALDFPDRSYAAVLNQPTLGENYAGSVLFVGALTDKEKQALGPGALRDAYGVHVHARVFSDLVKGSYPRHARPLWQLISLVAVLAAGLLARLFMPIKSVKIPIGWLKDFPLPVGFFIVAGVYLFVAGLIFRYYYVFFDLGYQLLALLVGYFAIPRLAGLVEAPAPKGKE